MKLTSGYSQSVGLLLCAHPHLEGEKFEEFSRKIQNYLKLPEDKLRELLIFYDLNTSLSGSLCLIYFENRQRIILVDARYSYLLHNLPGLDGHFSSIYQMVVYHIIIFCGSHVKCTALNGYVMFVPCQLFGTVGRMPFFIGERFQLKEMHRFVLGNKVFIPDSVSHGTQGTVTGMYDISIWYRRSRLSQYPQRFSGAVSTSLQ